MSYDYAGLLDRLYPDRPLPRDAIMSDGTGESPPRVARTPSKWSGGARAGALHLDERIEPGGDSTGEKMDATAVVPCLWQGCHIEFQVGTSWDVWKGHMMCEHIGERATGKHQSSKRIKCEWGGCKKTLEPLPHAVAGHLEMHIRNLDVANSDTEMGYQEEDFTMNTD